MSDHVITVRLPAPLLQALKGTTHDDYYADLSEQLRSIIRKGLARNAEPSNQRLEELKTELKAELERATNDQQVEQLLAGLKTLLGGGR